MTNKIKKILLIILDGFGVRDNPNFNAVLHAKMPNFNNYIKKYAYGLIDASGEAVGLPSGQFGNSEVGHLNIGAGRVVTQYITTVDNAILDRSFEKNSVLLSALSLATTKQIHIMGLLSDGGVHAHINHIFALIKLAHSSGHIHTIWLHLFLDGRDTPPQSAIKYINELLQFIDVLNQKHHKIKIATMGGRYYGMDRDKRYDRLRCAYDAIVFGNGDKYPPSPIDIINNSYQNNIFDEFIKPHVLNGYTGIYDGDSIIFSNFRSDRAIQLTDAITNPKFNHFETKKLHLGSFVTMTQYDNKLNANVAFQANIINNTLGEYLSNLGLSQLRITETEKYPHVTYFLNGGKKDPFENEHRILIDSPKNVKTYDEKPEMSLPEVADKLVHAIESDKFDVIITNFANGDMVGHTGNFASTIKAVEYLDEAIHKCVNAMLDINGEILIIADHGNCEEMYDYTSHQPHTQHTTNLVPCVYIGRTAQIVEGGALKDVAPTLLDIIGITPPIEMTGHSLIKWSEN